MTGTRSIDQMVEAAIWLMVQGDRAGAEDLLVQALRIDPSHERARQAMKSIGATTRPGEQAPRDPALDRPSTQPGRPSFAGSVPPGLTPVAHSAATPLEPVPALQRPPAPGFGAPRGTLPHGTPVQDVFADRSTDSTLPGSDLPFANSPSAVQSAAERRDDRTDRHHAPPQPPVSTTQPRLEVPPLPTGVMPSMTRSWSLEVLNGPHLGKSLPMSKRPMLIGRGLGVLDVENDFFMSPAHASFFQRNGELWISDGGSASGTWLSVDAPARLNPGDSFSVGLQRLRYLGPLEPAPTEQPWPYGAPRPASSWRLEHVLVGNRPARTWLLRGVVTLGREGVPVKFPDDESLAPVHAELRPAGSALELLDRSGRNGTFVMVTPGDERRLPEGTRVRLGSTIFRVVFR